MDPVKIPSRPIQEIVATSWKSRCNFGGTWLRVSIARHPACNKSDTSTLIAIRARVNKFDRHPEHLHTNPDEKMPENWQY
jgi:hypothetical protein